MLIALALGTYAIMNARKIHPFKTAKLEPREIEFSGPDDEGGQRSERTLHKEETVKAEFTMQS